jgi:hypothetical protein
MNEQLWQKSALCGGAGNGSKMAHLMSLDRYGYNAMFLVT